MNHLTIKKVKCFCLLLLIIIVNWKLHRCNRAAQHELERDASDKFQALNLDSTCHQMRNSSRGIAYHDGVERVDNT